MLRNYKLWVPDYNRASNYYKDFPLTEHIFNQPISIWLTGRPKMRKIVDRAVSRMVQRAAPYKQSYVLYAIPDRDLGQYSAGGFVAEQEYLSFCKRLATGLGNSKSMLILEPDAIPHSTLMDKAAQAKRLNLLCSAVDVITENSNALVYIDIGHSNWLSAQDAVSLLNRVNIKKARGFSVNISNYRTTEESVAWAESICALFDHKISYVVDTSRNGVGPLGNEWCNPPGRAIGQQPTTKTPSYNCDALLWIKVPGESDGRCNRGPIAGKFWPEQAVWMLQKSPHYTNIISGT